MSEANTDNLVANLITTGKGYPAFPDTKNADGIVYYTQNSYTSGMCPNPTLTKLFSKASKSKSGRPGKPEFVIDTPDFYIVIEDKDDAIDTLFSGYSDISEYIGKGYDTSRLYKCPIDDVLWYADHLKTEKDVIAIANYSDGTISNFKSATFYYPKNGSFDEIALVCVGGYSISLLPLSDYKTKISELNGEMELTYEQLYDELRKYAETSSRFMYKVHVDDADRLGLVSIVALALTNKKSDLFKKVSTPDSIISDDDIRKALLESTDIKKLGIIISNGLPPEKITTLQEYINRILMNSDLTRMSSELKEWDEKDKSKEQYFAGSGDTILTRITYSIYKNIILTYDKYKDKGIDVMGTFYSLFLVYYASDKKKGIVLTPSHVTRLFCDLAEFYGKKKITKDTTILDICTGSGGFLIAALNYIDRSIDNDESLTDSQRRRFKVEARKNCLVGAENAKNMFMLAYANMNFHGDGSSRLYNLNSLESSAIEDEPNFGSELCQLYDPSGEYREEIYAHLKESIEQAKKESNEEYENRLKDLALHEVFKQHGADIGMINPPYGKDYHEYDFINAELEYLRKEGIGIAIVPVSNQSSSKNKEKTAILQKHTLLASILMPTQLFVNVRNSGAMVGTCILVFKAHIPHQDFLKSGGKTFLADWREDGFRMVNKKGRFEEKNHWYASTSGYRDMYLSDMEKTVNNDFEKLTALNSAYKAAFPDEAVSQATMIPSSSFKKDIHEGGLKSIMVGIFSNPHLIQEPKYYSKSGINECGDKYQKGDPKYVIEKTDIPKTDEQGNVIYQKNGKPKTTKVPSYKLDSSGNRIILTEPKEVYDNMDWNILDYVKTDYHDLSDTDFIKTLRNYKLFQYMLENDLLFDNSSEEEEDDA